MKLNFASSCSGTAVREGKSCFAEIDPNFVQELAQIIQ